MLGARPEPGYRPEELLADVASRLLVGSRHVAVGMASPIPALAALLARERGHGKPLVSLLQSQTDTVLRDGGQELFDCAGQGRLDVFFLSGGQIDGQANINLVGIGEYRRPKVRFLGSFGSAYLYFVVPKVILLRFEHTRRTLVDRVNFISAPGVSPATVHRPGGPVALLTQRCLFAFDRSRPGFRLVSIHPGHDLDEVVEHTGFAFEHSGDVPTTAPPSAASLQLLRTQVAPAVAEVYPRFAARVFGFGVPSA